MLGAGNHHDHTMDHTMCQRQLSPECRLLEEDGRTQKPHVQLEQAPGAAVVEKPRWQDTNPLQQQHKVGHVNTTCLC